MLRTSFGMSRVTLRFSTHFDRRTPSRFSAEVAPPPSRTRPLSLDGDMKQVRQTPLRVSPALRPHLAEHLRLRLGPERTRDLQGSSSLGCESHRLDAPVGVRNTLDHTIPLQEVEAPRQGRLVDGKRVLELPQIRGAHAGDRRENAELSYPQTARPQDVVVQLCHGPAHHAECIADACGQPSRVVSAHRSGASSIHDLMLSATSLTGKPLACRYILPYACGSIDFGNPASDGRRLKGQAEPRDMTDRRYDPNVTRSVQDPDVVAPQATVPRFDLRTRLLLEGPIVGTLLRLATPNVLGMFVQAAVRLIETYFVAKLGTDALAGVALVFPVLMLMQMMSAGAVGGGIMSAIARALGAGRRADADALVFHALAIAVSFGLVFMLAVLGGGRWLYGALGGRGASLAAALTYSNVVFSGAILIWIFNSLANVIRGTGNMAVPAAVTSVGAAALIPLSPCLIFGWGPFPRLGVAGGAVAVVAYYAVGSVALTPYLWAGRSVVRLAFEGARFRWPLFRDILRGGAGAALITVQTNLTIALATGFVGRFGPAAIAGYDTGSRVEYLLVPLVFGLGGPLVAMVGTNIGAGQRGRALRTAWIGAAIAAGLTELIGLGAALAPHVWLSLFDTDPAMLDAGSRYLQTVGPLYGLFGLGMALYFASQGAGRLLWPLLANLTRLAIAAGGGWLALRWTGNLSHVFLALSAALAAFGLINAGAVASGAWFGRVGRPRDPTTTNRPDRPERETYIS